MRIQHITETDFDIEIKGVTLLSLDEYYKYKDLIPEVLDFNFWWTKTPVGIASAYAIDDVDGSVYEFGYGVNLNSMGVRPALLLKDKDFKLLHLKDRVLVDNCFYTIVDFNYNHGFALAVCDKILYNNYFNDTDDNTWETSSLKNDLEQRFAHLIK